MSILDNKSAAQRIKEDNLIMFKERYFWDWILRPAGAFGIEAGNSNSNDFVESMLKHTDRPVIRLDCRKLGKYDAIGWLKYVSKLPLTPKPILVIENITEIPEEDSVHDNPQYVQNLLIHSWKNGENEFTDSRSWFKKQFKIKPHDYLIFLTWRPETRDKLKQIWLASDSLEYYGNYEEYKKKITDGITLDNIETYRNKLKN